MKKYVLLFLFLSSCEGVKPSVQMLRKSIAFHDPKGQWGKMDQKLQIKSDFVFPDLLVFDLQIEIDNPNQALVYTNHTLGESVPFTDSNCVVLKGNKSCEQTACTKNFYHFVMGLPITLQNDEALY